MSDNPTDTTGPREDLDTPVPPKKRGRPRKNLVDSKTAGKRGKVGRPRETRVSSTSTRLVC